MKLYLNEVSSAASRVRIALALKGLSVETQQIGILGLEAESRKSDYRRINPLGLVPALETDDGLLITQSLAIIEYLDELRPDPALLPTAPVERALARSIALSIASEIHALLTPRVALHLTDAFNADSQSTTAWNRHWVGVGLDAVERLLHQNRRSVFAINSIPTVADIFLYPQAIGAKRLGFDLGRWPNISDVFSRLETLPAFAENAPAPRK
ncbi:maleylacetoacetate isomerase [Rhizobium sp. S163]|uniref:maleylacetoacetate isomerase n=1 Tax=Rhizobium sp. S163 TaxID=3055039 RepID=UPI0025AA04E5|nr:maleylacetoacetate isomerase [Rhizobium sp. S163]MDM9648659.1 maleylacetoacetate isomerase [Rhizobium sp. S163]